MPKASKNALPFRATSILEHDARMQFALRSNLIDESGLLFPFWEFGLFTALRYTRPSLDPVYERTTRISKFLSCRTCRAFGSYSLEPQRGFAADGCGGLSSASAVRRDDA